MISDGENGGSSPFKLSVISFINPNTFCCDNNKQYPKTAHVVVTIYILTLTTFKIFCAVPGATDDHSMWSHRLRIQTQFCESSALDIPRLWEVQIRHLAPMWLTSAVGVPLRKGDSICMARQETNPSVKQLSHIVESIFSIQ